MVEQWFKQEGWRGGATRQVRESTHNLQLHRLPLQLNRPDLEVDPNSAQVAVRERILREPQEQT